MKYFAAFIGVVAALLVVRRFVAGLKRRRVLQLVDELADIAARCFLVEPCARCHENEMLLVDVSPNARSLEYACLHCDKHMRAAAASPEAAVAAGLYEALLGHVLVRAQQTGDESHAWADVVFNTPEAPLPYERTTRTPIAEAIRSEVWRRDLGACVECGAKDNLEFDHIIPLAKGGATSARNLQLLCKACNLKKGSVI